MNTAKFFDGVRSAVFGGSLTQSQVDGLDMILAEADRRGVNNEYLAYILATTTHETAYTMQPIREYGKGRGRKYGVPHATTGQIYYGRGYVQLTWYDNYKKASKKLGVNFVDDPDRVMVPEYAVQILFEGMEEGWFTGKSLSDYIGVGKPMITEFANARRIINGTDKQIAIAEIAMSFLSALRDARRTEAPESHPINPQPDPVPTPINPQPDPEPSGVSLFIRVLRVILRILRALK